MTRATQPVLRLLVALAVAALFLLTAGPLVAGPARAQEPAPAPAVEPSPAPAPAGEPAAGEPAPAPAAAESVGIADRAGVLSDGDDALLRTETPRIDFPPQVRNVAYLVFDDGRGNRNDTVLE